MYDSLLLLAHGQPKWLACRSTKDPARVFGSTKEFNSLVLRSVITLKAAVLPSGERLKVTKVGFGSQCGYRCGKFLVWPQVPRMLVTWAVHRPIVVDYHISLLCVWYSTTIGRWTAQVTSMRGTCGSTESQDLLWIVIYVRTVWCEKQVGPSIP